MDNIFTEFIEITQKAKYSDTQSWKTFPSSYQFNGSVFKRVIQLLRQKSNIQSISTWETST